jgi:peptide/nickel transport system substrate-binding protein
LPGPGGPQSMHRTSPASLRLVSRPGSAWPGFRAFATVALAVMSGVTGCSRTAHPSSQSDSLRIGARGSAETPKVLRESLFAEPLIALDPQGRPVERLATAWAWDSDGLSLRITLRPGVRFHDGSPLTGPVVAAILRQQLDTSGFEAVDHVEAPDNGSVIFHLSRPDAFLIQIIAGALIVDDNKPDVGTGPFKIVSQKPVLEAVRFPGYYRGSPGIERVKVLPFDTQRAAWAALMRGEVDMVQEVNRDSVEFLEGATRISVYSSLRPFYIPLVFNLRHPILKQVEVRRALSEAINRDEIVNQAMGGRGQVADDPVWPSHWAYNPAAPRYSYNPGAARIRLDSLGLRVHDGDAQSAMASRFRLRCLFWDGDPQFERIALLLQRQLAAVGVDLVLQGGSEEQLLPLIRAGNFDTYLFQMTSGRSFDWVYRFWHSPDRGHEPEFQDSGYAGVDRALDQLRLARTEPEIREAIGDLRGQFYQDAPAAFLAWVQNSRAVDSRFDVGDRSDPEVFTNLWRWRTVDQVARR